MTPESANQNSAQTRSKRTTLIEMITLFVLMLCIWAQYGFIGNVASSRGVNYIGIFTTPLDNAIPFSATWALFLFQLS